MSILLGKKSFEADLRRIKTALGMRNKATLVDIVTSTTTVTNTTTETTIFTASVPANSLRARDLFIGHIDGVITNATASDDITIRLKLGSTTLNTFNPAIGNVTGEDWHFDGNLTIRTIGAAGTYAFHGHVEIDGNDTWINATGSVDTTAEEDFTVTIEWDNAKAGNTISIYQGYVIYNK